MYGSIVILIYNMPTAAREERYDPSSTVCRTASCCMPLTAAEDALSDFSVAAMDWHLLRVSGQPTPHAIAMKMIYLRKACVCSRRTASCFSMSNTKVDSACTPRSWFTETIIVAARLVICWIYYGSADTSQWAKRATRKRQLT